MDSDNFLLRVDEAISRKKIELHHLDNDERAEIEGIRLLESSSDAPLHLSIGLDDLTGGGSYDSLLRFISTCPFLEEVTLLKARNTLEQSGTNNESGLIVGRFMEALNLNTKISSFTLKNGLNVFDTDLILLLKTTKSLQHLGLEMCRIMDSPQRDERSSIGRVLAQAFASNLTLKSLILEVNEPFLPLILYQMNVNGSLQRLEIRCIQVQVTHAVHVACAIQQILSSPWTCRLDTLVVEGLVFRKHSLECIMEGLYYQSKYYPIQQKQQQEGRKSCSSSSMQSAEKRKPPQCCVLQNLIFRNCVFLDHITEYHTERYLHIFGKNLNLQTVRVINSSTRAPPSERAGYQSVSGGGRMATEATAATGTSHRDRRLSLSARDMAINPDRRTFFTEKEDRAKLELICTRNRKLKQLFLDGNVSGHWESGDSSEFRLLLPRIAEIILSSLASPDNEASGFYAYMSGIRLVCQMLLSAGDMDQTGNNRCDDK